MSIAVHDTAGFSPWIGVDLDGTLVIHTAWTKWNAFGDPIPRMVERVKIWLAEGREVRIFTARVCFAEDTCYKSGERFTRADMVEVIHQKLESMGLPRLPVTHEKDFRMVELWDDRAIQVIPNTGVTLAEEHEAKIAAALGQGYKPENA